MLKDFLLAAFFAVLTAVGGILSIPTPFFVPFTMQTFVVLMSGLMLGPKYGPMSQLLYVLMGLVGMPVLAGGTGGVHHVLSPTFGFLVGFVAAAKVAGSLAPKTRTARQYGLVCLAATAVLYAVALPWFYLNMNFVTGIEMSLFATFKVALLPFVLPDLLKAAAAGTLACRTIPMLKDAGLLPAKARL